MLRLQNHVTEGGFLIDDFPHILVTSAPASSRIYFG